MKAALITLAHVEVFQIEGFTRVGFLQVKRRGL